MGIFSPFLRLDTQLFRQHALPIPTQITQLNPNRMTKLGTNWILTRAGSSPFQSSLFRLGLTPGARTTGPAFIVSFLPNTYNPKTSMFPILKVRQTRLLRCWPNKLCNPSAKTNNNAGSGNDLLILISVIEHSEPSTRIINKQLNPVALLRNPSCTPRDNQNASNSN